MFEHSGVDLRITTCSQSVMIGETASGAGLQNTIAIS